jgi:Protein of unknown function (DUF3616)
LFNRLAGVALAVSLWAATAPAQSATIEFRGAGTCDASAAVALDERQIVVGDDEQPWLATFDVTTHALLGTTTIEFLKGSNEADIEGATILRGQVVWITSHGRDGKGRAQASRQLLFSSHHIAADGSAKVRIVGPFRDLLSSVIAHSIEDPIYARLHASIGSLAADVHLAPKVGGFNIEGLTTSEGLVPQPERPSLLIGLRNPAAADGRAILLELRNALNLLDGVSTKADLGPAILLNLGGRRIRDIAWSPNAKSYMIIGGPVGDDAKPFADGYPLFVVFKWNGREDTAPVALYEVGEPDSPYDFRAEAIVPLLAREAGKLVPSNRVLLLSDDGKRQIKGVQCSKLPPAERYFRGIIINVQ